MGAITPAIANCAPGNALALTCTGLSNGAASVVFTAQGSVNAAGRATGNVLVVIPATVATVNSVQTLAFTIPDGLCSGAGVVSQAEPALVATLNGNIATLSGGIQAGDVIGVMLGGLGASYMVKAGDTLATIASSLAAIATTAGIQCVAAGATINVTSVATQPPASLVPAFTVATTASGTPLQLRVVSQYVQAAEYIGEGFPTAVLAAGELDAILRRASSYVDAIIGGTKRQLQFLEQHKYRKSRKVFWYHKPAISVDALVFVSANQIRTTFNVGNDTYEFISGGYVDILAYALGQYALLGSLEVIGFSANVIELTVTAGFPQLLYPDEIREATTIIATDFLNWRLLNSLMQGPYDSVDASGDVTRRKDPKDYEVPERARRLLKPWRTLSIR